jgi:hypothetical protein
VAQCAAPEASVPVLAGVASPVVAPALGVPVPVGVVVESCPVELVSHVPVAVWQPA